MARKEEKMAWGKRPVWVDWLMLSAAIVVLFLVLWVVTGCAYQGVLGDGCVLCDSVPSPRGPGPMQNQALAALPVIRTSPAVRFNGSAMVSLDWTLHHLEGEILQGLKTACGITQTDAVNEYNWPTDTAHNYRVKLGASNSWHEGITTISVSAMVSRLQMGYQRREYVFMKNGSGSATYGESYGAYGARRVGMYRNADAAVRFAAAAAIANLCGGILSYNPVADTRDTTPQDVPAPCLPPDCYEETRSISGTWGGYGINSHWPSRPAYAPPARHHHGHGVGRGGGRRGK